MFHTTEQEQPRTALSRVGEIILIAASILTLVLFLAARARAAEEAPPPKALTIGTRGSLQFSGLLQAWHELQNKAGASSFNQFRIRRAEIKLKGEIMPKELGFDVMFDPAKVQEKGDKRDVAVTGKAADGTEIKSSGAIDLPSKFSVFQDLSMTYKRDWTEISIGQFKIPVSYEGFNSSSKLIFPERSLVAKNLGDARDLGIRFAKSFERWGYNAGIFNGTGLNVKDANDDKDATLRLEAYPVSSLTLAGVFYGSIIGTDKEHAGKKQRLEADIKWEPGWFLLQGEFILGKDKKGDTETDLSGFYAVAGYTLNEWAVQPVVRVGQFDPNTETDHDHAWHYDAGINYFIPRLKQHEGKLQVAASRFIGGSAPKAKTSGKNETQVITAFQIAF